MNDASTFNTAHAQAIYLFCTEGSSDKVYQASLHSQDGGWVVEFAYGRRGQTLKTGTKTSNAVSYTEALKMFNKLVKEKTSKGYTEDQTGLSYTCSEHKARVSGHLPQLPTAIAASEVAKLLENDGWGMQQKRDGENRMLLIKDHHVQGINRKGLFVDIPLEWSKQFSIFPDCLIAGEAVGDNYYAFDLLEHNGCDLRKSTFRMRFCSLNDMFSKSIMTSKTLGNCFKIIPLIFTSNLKRDHLRSIEVNHGEGVVFKDLNAPFVIGKCQSSLKHKFVESATCIVLRKNTQRSIAVGLLDENGTLLDLGNVTIPENSEIPVINSLVEIRYLYRFENGCFEQPVYLGIRNDIDLEDALLSQVTRKKLKSLMAG